jgi:hypothetical protein
LYSVMHHPTFKKIEILNAIVSAVCNFRAKWSK